jgi:FAD/FMN-containing dehydrogenase
MTTQLDRLPASLAGVTIRPEAAGYDDARAVWNGRIDVRPALIVRPPSVGAVADALRFGREAGLPIAIRGGAHSVSGHGTVDGGLVIDLAALDSIDIDASTRVARVGGGVRWGQLDAASARHGLATVGGQISTTGVAGLTLGGGVGWLMNAYGLSVDNLRSVDLVDAEGGQRIVSAASDPDLFWALRGGGGNFGIGTTLEFDLHPVSNVLAGTLLHPFERAAEMIEIFREVSESAPDELAVMVILLQAPRQPFIPMEHQGRPVALFAACWIGEPERGAELLRPMTSYGPPLVDSLRVRPYVELQTMFDVGSQPGFGNVWRSTFLHSFEDDTIATIAEHAGRMPTAISQVLLANLGGAVRRVPDDATAFPHRSAPFYIEVIAKYEPGADPAPSTAWAEAFDAAVRPWSTGYTYVNFLDARPGISVDAAYDPPTLARLAALKRRYDPDNVFRANHNIVPTP